MSDERQPSADASPAGTALPSYQEWIALPGGEQQKRRKAARAHLDQLLARFHSMKAYDDLDAHHRLVWEIGVAKYDVLPYDAATISYTEWTALPGDERDQVTLALSKRAVELQRRYPSMTDAERDAYEGEHRNLVQACIEERARTGSDIFGHLAIGKGHLVEADSWHRYPIRPQPPLRYDPGTISYKQWISMRGEERAAVVRALRERNFVESGPIREMTDAETAAGDEESFRLIREMNEEIERTGICVDGNNVLGNGIVIHVDRRRRPKPGARKYSAPPD